MAWIDDQCLRKSSDFHQTLFDFLRLAVREVCSSDSTFEKSVTSKERVVILEEIADTSFGVERRVNHFDLEVFDVQDISVFHRGSRDIDLNRFV